MSQTPGDLAAASWFELAIGPTMRRYLRIRGGAMRTPTDVFLKADSNYGDNLLNKS